MRIGVCNFSGFKIYPGHGKTYVKSDGKVFTFFNWKCEKKVLEKKNPRKFRWTVLYRLKHKKGNVTTVTKRKVRKTVKVQKDILGISLKEIIAKKNMKAEIKKAQKDMEQAIQATKDVKKSKAGIKKDAPKKEKQMPKVSKVQAKSAPRVGGKR